MYAIGNKYPIDNAGQLKTAAAYFSKYLSRFSHSDRAIIANNMEKQASVLGVDIDDDQSVWIINYSRWSKPDSQYSPDFDQNMRMRKEACDAGKIEVTIGGEKVMGSNMVTKLACNRDKMGPQSMMAALDEFDKIANLTSLYDSRLMDPVFTVYGSLSNPRYDAKNVADGVTDYQLNKIARHQDVMEKVASVVGTDFVDEFKKDPVGTFAKLKDPERVAVSRAAGI